MGSKNSNKSGWREKTSSWFSFDYKGYRATPLQRKEIVKPYMNWWDQSRLNRSIRESNNEYFNNLGKALKNIQTTQDLETAKKAYKDVITEDLIHDIYSIYYNKSEKLEFAKANDSNKVKFKILEKVNNSLLKIVSNDNSIASFMYTKEICNFLFTELWNDLTDAEKQALKNAMDKMNSEKGEEKEEEGEEGDSDEGDDSEGKEGDEKKKGKGKGKGKPGEDGDEDSDSDGENDSDGDKDGDGKEGKEGKAKDKPSESKNQSKGSQGDGRTKGSQGDVNENKKKDTAGHNVDENFNKSSHDKWREDLEKRKQKAAEERAQEKRNKPSTINDKLTEKLDYIFNRDDVRRRFDEAINKADQMMQDLEKAGIKLDKSDIQQMAEIANINGIRQDIAALSLNRSAIAEAIKNILDNSLNYFSKRYQIREVDLFEADEISDIFGVECIHPVFRSGMLDRLTTEERKPLGKIDLYIDVSGSMTSNSGIPGVSNLMFAKSIALAMLNMDLLRELYVFDTSVRKIECTEIGILTIGCGGGTEIDCVTRYIRDKSRNNGICLTDGECSVSVYDERMFLLGTIGVYFNYFYQSGETGEKFLKNGQCINFDGKTVNRIEYETDSSKRKRSRGW